MWRGGGQEMTPPTPPITVEVEWVYEGGGVWSCTLLTLHGGGDYVFAGPPIDGPDEGDGMLLSDLLDQSTLDYVAKVKARGK